MCFPSKNGSGPRVSGPKRLAAESLPVEARRDGFYCLWTFKEAYLKGLGKGLWEGLAALQVPPGEELVRKGAWIVRNVNAGAGFAAAVATEGECRLVGFEVRSLDPLKCAPVTL